MAEDDADQDLGYTTTEADDDRKTTQGASRRKRKSKSGGETYCRPRIDQLAIPNRRLVLDLYKNHAHHLAKEKVENIKQRLQELYAMTPEDTEKYFAHLKQKSGEIERRKNLKYLLKKLVKQRKKERQFRKAYDFLYRLLVRGMEYASKTSVPMLVSVRLRNLSDIILQQICYLRDYNVPSRDNPDRLGALLIRIADWIAIAVEHLYYGVQMKKNAELENIEIEYKEKEREAEKNRAAESQEPVEDTKPLDTQGGEDGVLSETLLVSDME